MTGWRSEIACGRRSSYKRLLYGYRSWKFIVLKMTRHRCVWRSCDFGVVYKRAFQTSVRPLTFNFLQRYWPVVYSGALQTPHVLYCIILSFLGLLRCHQWRIYKFRNGSKHPILKFVWFTFLCLLKWLFNISFSQNVLNGQVQWVLRHGWLSWDDSPCQLSVSVECVFLMTQSQAPACRTAKSTNLVESSSMEDRCPTPFAYESSSWHSSESDLAISHDNSRYLDHTHRHACAFLTLLNTPHRHTVYTVTYRLFSVSVRLFFSH